jgi:hypothetical protein
MLLRNPEEQDFPRLQALDLEVQRRLDPGFDALPSREREGRLRSSLPALRFWQRSEHSLVAENEGELVGALLAQSLWQGDRAALWISAIWLAGTAPENCAAALLRACTKGAYDAAVYELHLTVGEELAAAAAGEGYQLAGSHGVLYLGQRHQTAPG